MGMELTPAAKNLLATKGYDPVLGARPLRRTIQREIEDVLSEKILFGELKAGEIVAVDADGEGKEATFTFEGTPHTGPSRCPSWPSRADRRWCLTAPHEGPRPPGRGPSSCPARQAAGPGPASR